MRMDNCPHCGISLNGGSIWEHFYRETGSLSEADRIASMYGATRENGMSWRREIGIYDIDDDTTVAYKCPDCGGTWSK